MRCPHHPDGGEATHLCQPVGPAQRRLQFPGLQVDHQSEVEGEIEHQHAPPQQARQEKEDRLGRPVGAKHRDRRQHDSHHADDAEAEPGRAQLVVQLKNLHRADPGGAPESRPGAPAVAALLEIVEEADDEQIGGKVRLVFVTWPLGRAADHHLSKGAFA